MNKTLAYRMLRIGNVGLVAAMLASVMTRPVAADDVTVRKSDGVILVEGRPFFPIGMYHVSHSPKQDAMRLADLGVLAQAGFNVVATPLSLKNGGSFLEQAERLGIRVLVEANDPEGIPAVVKGLRGYPAVLAWLTYDDIDEGTIAPKNALKLHHEIKALHPDRPTYASGAYIERIAGFAGKSDLLGMQTYPIPDEDLSATSISVAVAVKAATALRQSVIANCQAFAWPKKRAPTPAELRNMTFQSVIAGVKGIIYYTLHRDSTLRGDIGPTHVHVYALDIGIKPIKK